MLLEPLVFFGLVAYLATGIWLTWGLPTPPPEPSAFGHAVQFVVCFVLLLLWLPICIAYICKQLSDK